jgi:hypothetical protein
VRLLHNNNAAITKRLAPSDDVAALAGEGYLALEAFEVAGVPTTYDDSEVLFLCGQQLCALDDDEIRTLLTKRLFRDATAAVVMCERGFRADIGLLQIREVTVEKSLNHSETTPDRSGSPSKCPGRARNSGALPPESWPAPARQPARRRRHDGFAGLSICLFCPSEGFGEE